MDFFTETEIGFTMNPKWIQLIEYPRWDGDRSKRIMETNYRIVMTYACVCLLAYLRNHAIELHQTFVHVEHGRMSRRTF